MSDLQKRYDDLDAIISTCRSLTQEISDKDYIDRFKDIQFDAQQELEEIEPILQKEQWAEEREQNIEYERSVI